MHISNAEIMNRSYKRFLGALAPKPSESSNSIDTCVNTGFEPPLPKVEDTIKRKKGWRYIWEKQYL